MREHTARCLADRGTELHRVGYGSCPIVQPERGGRLLYGRARLERRFLGQVHEHDARHERHALAVTHLRGAALRQPADPALLCALHVFSATSQRRLYLLARPVAATCTTAHRQPPASHAALRHGVKPASQRQHQLGRPSALALEQGCQLYPPEPCPRPTSSFAQALYSTNCRHVRGLRTSRSCSEYAFSTRKSACCPCSKPNCGCSGNVRWMSRLMTCRPGCPCQCPRQMQHAGLRAPQTSPHAPGPRRTGVDHAGARTAWQAAVLLAGRRAPLHSGAAAVRPCDTTHVPPVTSMQSASLVYEALHELLVHEPAQMLSLAPLAHLINLLLANADLQQRVVARALIEASVDRPGHRPYRRQQACPQPQCTDTETASAAQHQGAEHAPIALQPEAVRL